MSLWRYDGSAWEPLETTSIGNGTYTAETPGFSLFAVSKAATTTPTPEPTPTPVASPPSPEEPASADASSRLDDASTAPTGVVTGSSDVLRVLLVLGSLAVLLSVYRFLRRD